MNMWQHKLRRIAFCLCVDNFGIKYFDKQDVLHLQQTPQQTYTAKIELTETTFLGFTLDWQYAQGYVDISIPNYLKKLLLRIYYIPTIYPQYSPHVY